MVLHVYGEDAFRSELCLFRAHRVPTPEAERVEVEDGARRLFRVEVASGAPRFATDELQALGIFQREGGIRLAELAIA